MQQTWKCSHLKTHPPCIKLHLHFAITFTPLSICEYIHRVQKFMENLGPFAYYIKYCMKLSLIIWSYTMLYHFSITVKMLMFYIVQATHLIFVGKM